MPDRYQEQNLRFYVQSIIKYSYQIEILKKKNTQGFDIADGVLFWFFKYRDISNLIRRNQLSHKLGSVSSDGVALPFLLVQVVCVLCFQYTWY